MLSCSTRTACVRHDQLIMMIMICRRRPRRSIIALQLPRLPWIQPAEPEPALVQEWVVRVPYLRLGVEGIAVVGVKGLAQPHTLDEIWSNIGEVVSRNIKLLHKPRYKYRLSLSASTYTRPISYMHDLQNCLGLGIQLTRRRDEMPSESDQVRLAPLHRRGGRLGGVARGAHERSTVRLAEAIQRAGVGNICRAVQCSSPILHLLSMSKYMYTYKQDARSPMLPNY